MGYQEQVRDKVQGDLADGETLVAGRQSRLILEDARRETAQQEDVAGLPELVDLVAAALEGRPRPEPTTAS